MRLYGPLNSGAAAGSAGSATANADSSIRLIGRVVGIYVKYNDSPPAATTDVTIKAIGTSPAPPTYNLLVLTNAATDGWFYPRVQVCDTAGSAIANEYTPLVLHDYINLAIAQANAADNVDIWLLLSDYHSGQ